MLLLLHRKKCYNPTALGGYNTYRKDALFVCKYKTPLSSFWNHPPKNEISPGGGEFLRSSWTWSSWSSLTFIFREISWKKGALLLEGTHNLNGLCSHGQYLWAASGPPYYCAPLVCVLNDLEGLTVWRLCKPKKKQTPGIYGALPTLMTGHHFRQNLMSRCNEKGCLRAWILFSWLPKWLHLHAWVQAWVKLEL